MARCVFGVRFLVFTCTLSERRERVDIHHVEPTVCLVHCCAAAVRLLPLRIAVRFSRIGPDTRQRRYLDVHARALSLSIKVNVPLQVGEALCVDCSFGSAGGRPVPNTAAAGSRHRHPWLFQLTCGEGGQLKAQPSSIQHLKAFEVQLVSVVTGACQHSRRASFAASSGEGDSAVAGEERRAEPEAPSVSNGGGVPEVKGLDGIQIQMDELEQHLSRQQHSVFWEEVFDTLKAEALVDGKDGWLVHQDARCGDDVGAELKVAPDGVGRMDGGAKRRLVCLSPRGTSISGRTAGARVVHVLDDEVMVEMNSHVQLGYRLVPGQCLSGARAEGSRTAAKDRSEASERAQAASLCQLALLYCGSLVRQHQRTQVAARRGSGSNGRDVGVLVPASAASSRMSNGTAGGHLSASSTWKAVRRVLLHHLFRSEVRLFSCVLAESRCEKCQPIYSHVSAVRIYMYVSLACDATISWLFRPIQEVVQFGGLALHSMGNTQTLMFRFVFAAIGKRPH